MPEPSPVRVTFWGTRGSVAVGGAGTARHGGATPCVAIEAGSRLILDAGTGLRALGRAMPPGSTAGGHTILLSHLHWDHIAGLPFFPPLYDPAATVRILGPDQPTATVGGVVERLLDPAVWPLPVRARLDTAGVPEGAFQVAGFAIGAAGLAHPGRTLGYRIQAAAGPIVSYVTDNEVAAMHPAQRRELVQLVAGSDVLIHDATWPDALLPDRAGWGHSSAGEAVALGIEAGCRTVVLFHHDPDAGDDALDRLLAGAREQADRQGGPDVIAASDGLCLEI